jgi:hypothetical protein
MVKTAGGCPDKKAVMTAPWAVITSAKATVPCKLDVDKSHFAELSSVQIIRNGIFMP